jgi:tRNA threonylcarbamoyladenosine biosynthesis protein TsaB
MHSELATVELHLLLKEAGLTLADVTHLAVNVGPGSFTGLRVGISLVKTLAYTLRLPVYTANRLEILAATNSRPLERVFVATKAVQDHYYAAGFDHSPAGVLNPILKPRSASAAELDRLSVACTKVLIEGRSQGFEPATQAKDLVEMFARAAFKRPFSDWKSVEPLYIRGSEAEEKLKKGLLRPV